MRGRPRRHQRVWLQASIRADEIHGPTESEAGAVLAWLRRGCPFVRRAAAEADRVPLGLALAGPTGRARVGFAVDARHIARIDEPLRLDEAIPTMPPAMQAAARQLVEAAAALGVDVHVYGSVSWQHASGDVYLHETSDLDLLVRARNPAEATQWLQAVQQVQAGSPVRIDGELELPFDRAVAWRELAGPGRSVLVKSSTGPSLVDRAALWSPDTPQGLAC